MSASNLGLNDHHQTNVINYIRFARYQRGQNLRCIDACFRELKQSRLDENNYTISEVESMLDELHDEIKLEVENELINASHTNVLLLRQMFQQAEKWHLKLATDIAELENRELLEKIREFEEDQFAGNSREKEFRPSLEPMNESGGSALLRMEITRLEKEAEKYRFQLSRLEDQALTLNQEKYNLMQELDKACGRGAGAKVVQRTGGDVDVRHLEKDFERMRMDMERGRMTGEQLEDNLADAKHELLKVRSMLEMAERELEAKVSQTTPFRNLKVMLQKKNEQLKDLRRRLSKYEDLND